MNVSYVIPTKKFNFEHFSKKCPETINETITNHWINKYVNPLTMFGITVCEFVDENNEKCQINTFDEPIENFIEKIKEINTIKQTIIQAIEEKVYKKFNINDDLMRTHIFKTLNHKQQIQKYSLKRSRQETDSIQSQSKKQKQQNILIKTDSFQIDSLFSYSVCADIFKFLKLKDVFQLLGLNKATRMILIQNPIIWSSLYKSHISQHVDQLLHIKHDCSEINKMAIQNERFRFKVYSVTTFQKANNQTNTINHKKKLYVLPKKKFNQIKSNEILFQNKLIEIIIDHLIKEKRPDIVNHFKKIYLPTILKKLHYGEPQQKKYQKLTFQSNHPCIFWIFNPYIDEHLNKLNHVKNLKYHCNQNDLEIKNQFKKNELMEWNQIQKRLKKLKLAQPHDDHFLKTDKIKFKDLKNEYHFTHHFYVYLYEHYKEYVGRPESIHPMRFDYNVEYDFISSIPKIIPLRELKYPTNRKIDYLMNHKYLKYINCNLDWFCKQMKELLMECLGKKMFCVKKNNEVNNYVYEPLKSENQMFSRLNLGIFSKENSYLVQTKNGKIIKGKEYRFISQDHQNNLHVLDYGFNQKMEKWINLKGFWEIAFQIDFYNQLLNKKMMHNEKIKTLFNEMLNPKYSDDKQPNRCNRFLMFVSRFMNQETFVSVLFFIYRAIEFNGVVCNVIDKLYSDLKDKPMELFSQIQMMIQYTSCKYFGNQIEEEIKEFKRNENEILEIEKNDSKNFHFSYWIVKCSEWFSNNINKDCREYQTLNNQMYKKYDKIFKISDFGFLPINPTGCVSEAINLKKQLLKSRQVINLNILHHNRWSPFVITSLHKSRVYFIYDEIRADPYQLNYQSHTIYYNLLKHDIPQLKSNLKSKNKNKDYPHFLYRWFSDHIKICQCSNGMPWDICFSPEISNSDIQFKPGGFCKLSLKENQTHINWLCNRDIGMVDDPLLWNSIMVSMAQEERVCVFLFNCFCDLIC